MRLAQDAAVHGSDEKNRKLHVGGTPFQSCQSSGNFLIGVNNEKNNSDNIFGMHSFFSGE